MAKKPDINRSTAMAILLDIDRSRSYSNIAINAYVRQNRPDAEALVREIVYSVLRNRIHIDHILSSLAARPIGRIRPEALAILRMGIAQLAFMDSIPPYAAIHESVELAKKAARGQDGFVNAILRNFVRRRGELYLPDRERDPIAYLSVRYSYPEWLCRLWIEQYGPVFAEALMAAGNETPQLSVRANTLRISRCELIDALLSRGFEASEGRHGEAAILVKGTGLLDNDLFRDGFFSVQDESSMLAVEMLDPQPGETVFDVCAAPGGKTLYAAERMNNKGRIDALDLHGHKLELLQRSASKNGVTIIKTQVRDARVPDPDRMETADRVLVDAPCSGLGVVRRKPEIKYARTEESLDELSSIQQAILAASAGYVKKGGILLYSTCTLTQQENEKVVDRFLESRTDFEKQAQRTLFPHTDGTDGFFMSRMRKK